MTMQVHFQMIKDQNKMNEETPLFLEDSMHLKSYKDKANETFKGKLY